MATNTPGATISTGGVEPFAIAVTPDGVAAYAVNRDSNSVTPIDVATNTAGAPISVGERPVGIAIAPAPAVPAGPVCGKTGAQSGTTTMTCTYDTVGSDTFTVPAGVSSVEITATGAQGGHYFIAGDEAHPSPAGDITGRPGGSGGQATGTLTGLTGGQVLQVDVAGRGADGTAASRSGGMSNGPSGGSGALGGFGGSNTGVSGGPGDASGANGGTASNGGNGSGGGGSSDVRVTAGGCATLACGLSTRVLVAAGGGGAGGVGGQGNALGGAGGDAGTDAGATVDGGNAGVPGKAGTQTAGGSGGLNACRHGAGNPAPSDPLTDPRCGGDGTDGISGAGGTGGAGNKPCNGTYTPACSNPTATTSGGGAGGGAGGGYFGGGGGAGGGGTFGGYGGAGAGGAGGSSFAASSIVNPALATGANSGTVNGGNGEVTITWTTSGTSVPTPLPAPEPTPVPSPTPALEPKP
ncbi:hypothetical protein [Frankia sp. AvcI1]|uniref:hypothetical protein n=1 Tax=Frankia sp. AvcI1 TaxID=573496 RepID=UPI0022865709|nr:hypothetical protein [Frankia sp. AvcI1]